MVSYLEENSSWSHEHSLLGCMINTFWIVQKIWSLKNGRKMPNVEGLALYLPISISVLGLLPQGCIDTWEVYFPTLTVFLFLSGFRLQLKVQRIKKDSIYLLPICQIFSLLALKAAALFIWLPDLILHSSLKSMCISKLFLKSYQINILLFRKLMLSVTLAKAV